jgi:hypothetical protein
VTGSPDDKPLWNGVAVLAVVIAIVGVITRPFLCEPIAAILMLVAAKQNKDQRFTLPGIVLITVCAITGAALAAAFSHPLY